MNWPLFTIGVALIAFSLGLLLGIHYPWKDDQ